LPGGWVDKQDSKEVRRASQAAPATPPEKARPCLIGDTWPLSNPNGFVEDVVSNLLCFITEERSFAMIDSH
jgi:hypothetical protein